MNSVRTNLREIEMKGMQLSVYYMLYHPILNQYHIVTNIYLCPKNVVVIQSIGTFL